MDPSLIIFIIILVGLFLLFSMSGRSQRKRSDTLYYENLRKSEGGMPSKNRSEEYRKHLGGYYKKHPAEYSIDNITWSDLELDRIYDRVDYTDSAAGEEYLYWLLRTPALSKDSFALSEEQIESIQNSDNERRSLKKILHEAAGFGRYSIYDYIDEIDTITKKSVLSNLYAVLLLAAAVIVLFISTTVGVIVFFAAVAFNVITYYREKSRIDPYLSTLRNILSMINCADKLCSLKTGETDTFLEEREALRSITGQLAAFRRASFLLSSNSVSGNPLDLVFDYVRILLHLDLIKFYSMIGEMTAHLGEIDRMITLIGKIDATISVACFRASLPSFSVPELVSPENGNILYDAEDLYHPLLAEPVTNSICTAGHILVTGSNASGKSTFLKASAICALLSQTLRTATAASYKGSYFRIFTSMSLRDDLSGGDSYYIVEIRSLKRILDAAADGNTAPVLCFIDEILRGTNTVERIAASTEILRSFCGRGISCFAATHDIELTSLLDGLYHNYHFDENIVNDDVLFSYKLLEGRSNTRNAIRLLHVIGYDEQITERAEKRAADFIRTGEWKKE